MLEQRAEAIQERHNVDGDINPTVQFTTDAQGEKSKDKQAFLLPKEYSKPSLRLARICDLRGRDRPQAKEVDRQFPQQRSKDAFAFPAEPAFNPATISGLRTQENKVLPKKDTSHDFITAEGEIVEPLEAAIVSARGGPEAQSR